MKTEKKNKHMELDDRIEIQECLCKGMTFKAINVTPDQLLADSLPQDSNDLNSLLLDCTPEEVSILVESFTGLKKVLSKYLIKE